MSIDKIYEKGYIYSIRFNDQIIYVGSTVNFDGRKKDHKSRYSNPNDKEHNQKKYQIMRSLSKNFDDFEFRLEDVLANIIRLDLKEPENYYKNLLQPIGNTDNIRPEIQIHKSVDLKAYRHELRNIPENKEKIKQHQSKPWYCQFCNNHVTLGHKARHEKTINHLKNFITY